MNLTRNSSCPADTFLDSASCMKLFSHLLSIITTPINMFTIYVIYTATPPRMTNMKNLMVIMHILAAANDFIFTTLIIPYIFFPAVVGKQLGFFDDWGVPETACSYLFAFCLGETSCLIVLMFELRHRCIVSGRWKMTRNVTRKMFIAFNSVYPIIFPIPALIQVPEQESAMLKILETIPCPTTEFFTLQPFVLIDDPAFIVTLFLVSVLIYTNQFLVFFFHSLLHVFDSSANLSTKTQILQRKFFISLTIQIFIPLFLLSIPVSYFAISVATSYYNQAVNNVAYLVISMHGCVSCIVTLLVYTPYRQYILSFIFPKLAQNMNKTSIVQVSAITHRMN